MAGASVRSELGPSPRVLLVEDDVALAHEVSTYLERRGLSVRCLYRGEGAPEAARNADLIVLDWMLPGLDGLTLCQSLRACISIPILMLTARDGDANEVRALTVGADDFLAKPVRPAVLLARIHALLRRSQSAKPREGKLVVGPLQLNPSTREATVAGEPVATTDAEFHLLHLLMKQAGRIVSRDTLSLELCGRPFDGRDRTVDHYISRLRRKLGDDARAPALLKTVRGEGYLLVGKVRR